MSQSFTISPQTEMFFQEVMGEYFRRVDNLIEAVEKVAAQLEIANQRESEEIMVAEIQQALSQVPDKVRQSFEKAILQGEGEAGDNVIWIDESQRSHYLAHCAFLAKYHGMEIEHGHDQTRTHHVWIRQATGEPNPPRHPFDKRDSVGTP